MIACLCLLLMNRVKALQRVNITVSLQNSNNPPPVSQQSKLLAIFAIFWDSIIALLGRFNFLLTLQNRSIPILFSSFALFREEFSRTPAIIRKDRFVFMWSSIRKGRRGVRCDLGKKPTERMRCTKNKASKL